MSFNRPYTGLSDISGAPKPNIAAVEKLVNMLAFGFGMKRVGTIGSNLNSVHASGRAFDIRCWSDALAKKGPKDPNAGWLSTNFEENNWNLINFLYLHRYDLYIEEIHDYVGIYVPGTMCEYGVQGRGDPSGYGAGYRCDREFLMPGHEEYGKTPIVPGFLGWKKWGLEAHAKHNGDSVGKRHIHVEVSPVIMLVDSHFEKRLANYINNYWKNLWRSVQISGKGLNTKVKTYPRNKLKRNIV